MKLSYKHQDVKPNALNEKEAASEINRAEEIPYLGASADIYNRSEIKAGHFTQTNILNLQRTVGNQSVLRMLNKPTALSATRGVIQRYEMREMNDLDNLTPPYTSAHYRYDDTPLPAYPTEYLHLTFQNADRTSVKHYYYDAKTGYWRAAGPGGNAASVDVMTTHKNAAITWAESKGMPKKDSLNAVAEVKKTLDFTKDLSPSELKKLQEDKQRAKDEAMKLKREQAAQEKKAKIALEKQVIAKQKAEKAEAIAKQKATEEAAKAAEEAKLEKEALEKERAANLEKLKKVMFSLAMMYSWSERELHRQASAILDNPDLDPGSDALLVAAGIREAAENEERSAYYF